MTMQHLLHAIIIHGIFIEPNSDTDDQDLYFLSPESIEKLLSLHLKSKLQSDLILLQTEMLVYTLLQNSINFGIEVHFQTILILHFNF